MRVQGGGGEGMRKAGRLSSEQGSQGRPHRGGNAWAEARRWREGAL